MTQSSKTPAFPKITAPELSNYVVCPESWRLQREHRLSVEPSVKQVQAREGRAAWEEQQGLLVRLGGYTRVAYLSLFLVAIVVFLLEHQRISRPAPGPRGGIVATVPDELALLMLVLGTVIFLWDLFERRSAALRKDLGLTKESEMVTGTKSSEGVDEHDLHSDSQNLSSRPNAVLREDGFLIPVDIHPTTDKVRDRHVVAMLLHLAILEEREGKASPYGVLIMGKAQRRTQIRNTPEKQRWLWTLIDEIRSIIGGVPAVPAPALYKCRNCRVKQFCAFNADKAEPQTPGRSSPPTTPGPEER